MKKSLLFLGLLFCLPCAKGARPVFDYDFDYASLPKAVYKICRLRGTEPAYSGQYDKFYEEGTYFCNCCGGDYPLFNSETKFDSGTGWPSFWAPINDKAVVLTEETRIVSRLLGARIEVLCGRCGSHLGHVFDDGPKDKTGKRYCMNSLALHFEPNKLQEK